MKRLFRVILSLIILVALVLPIAQAEPVKASSTLTIYSTSSDAYLRNVGMVYATTRTATSGDMGDTSIFVVGQTTTGIYGIWRSYVFFDTSSIPDTANITSATLHLYGAVDYSTTDFDIVVQTGNNTYPHNPVVLADYNYNLYANNFSSLNTASVN